MEDKKIRYNGDVVETSCFPQSVPLDNTNTWKNEVWIAKGGDSKVLYLKNKTWQNCWKRYGMLGLMDGNQPNSPRNPYIDKFNNAHRFPSIVNLKDFIEQGGTLSHIYKRCVNQAWFRDELYKITPTIDWSRCGYYYGLHRSWNFLGSQWFTHAWDNKGVQLGQTGWGKPWVFNFTHDKVHRTERGAYGVTLPFFFAGADILDVHFRCSEGVLIENIQGIFKATQTESRWVVENPSGQPLVSTATTGMSPYVISEAFKQSGEKITKTPSMYYGNVTDCSQVVYETWGLREVSSYNNEPLGNESVGNTLVVNKAPNDYLTNDRVVYPNFGRNCDAVFGMAHGLTKIGPCIDAKFAFSDNLFANSPNIQEMRLKNINYTNWNFNHLTKLDEASVSYLLHNVWDRQRGFNELKKVEGQDSTTVNRVKKTYLVQDQERKTITCPSQWEGFITQEMINKVIDRGWNLVVGGQTKTKKEEVVFRNSSDNSYSLDLANREITINNKCSIEGGEEHFTVRLPYTGIADRYTLENFTDEMVNVTIDNETSMLIIKFFCRQLNGIRNGIIKLIDSLNYLWTITLGSYVGSTKYNVVITPSVDEDVRYTVNGQSYTGSQTLQFSEGTSVRIVADERRMKDNRNDYVVTSVGGTNGVTHTIDRLSRNEEISIVSRTERVVTVTFYTYTGGENSDRGGVLNIETINE